MYGLDDMDIHFAGELYLQHRVEDKGWTFIQFLAAYARNEHGKLIGEGTE